MINPHDDGISLDVIVDWLLEEGASITRIDDHAEWIIRFEAALRSLPEVQRHRTALALLDAYRVPEQPLRGAVAPTELCRAAVRTAKTGSAQDIPRVSRELIHKYLADLEQLELV